MCGNERHLEETRYKILVKITRWSQSGLLASIFWALAMAVVWWSVAALVIGPLGIAPIWHDQEVDFTQAPKNLDNPYETPRYVYPPWTAVLLIPFSFMPLPLAVLIQICVFFVLLAVLIHRYGGNTGHVILVVTSYWAFDNGLELNIDWLPVLGILVPAFLSGPLLLTKPQVALGVWLSYSRKQLIRAANVTLALLAVSFILWDNWPEAMWDSLQRWTLTDEYYDQFNLAPIALLPVPISLAIGAWIGWHAFKQRSVILSLLAWMFFVPYIPTYTMIVYFVPITMRLPFLAFIINVTMWIIYGGVILFVVLFRL
ncbi:MAG: hypothetical protein GYB66_03670 [Chloroflexi bacterium]|nr:hypothetical protein [Chloroflexota bacterium]